MVKTGRTWHGSERHPRTRTVAGPTSPCLKHVNQSGSIDALRWTLCLFCPCPTSRSNWQTFLLSPFQLKKPSSQSEAGWDATPGGQGLRPSASPASAAVAQAASSSPGFAARRPPGRHAVSSARTRWLRLRVPRCQRGNQTVNRRSSHRRRPPRLAAQS